MMMAANALETGVTFVKRTNKIMEFTGYFIYYYIITVFALLALGLVAFGIGLFKRKASRATHIVIGILVFLLLVASTVEVMMGLTTQTITFLSVIRLLGSLAFLSMWRVRTNVLHNQARNHNRIV